MTGHTPQYRLFPRYDISNIPFHVTINDHSANLLDVSVSGIRIQSSELIPFPDNNSLVNLSSDNFNFTISTEQIWYANDPDGSIHYGLHLYFNKLSNFDGWLKLIKALHYLSLKSPYELPDLINRS